MKLHQIVVGPVSTNCYVVDDGEGRAAVVDPGAAPDRIVALLEENGLAPELILLTHGHFDHLGGIKGLTARYPGLRVAIGTKDVPMLAAAANSPMVRLYAGADDYAGLKADIEVGEGDVLTAGALSFAVVDTPGHTLGGVCYRCGDCLFTGDTLFCGDIGRTDLDGGDYPTLMRSVKKLGELPGDYQVLPGHEERSTLEDERRGNRYLREALQCF